MAEPQLSGEVESVILNAKELARARDHGFVGTEHLLLALVRSNANSSFARRVLDDVGATEAIRARIEAVIGP
jgi:ATP-dependent Clp protease ATP-binding subunit ClpA